MASFSTPLSCALIWRAIRRSLRLSRAPGKTALDAFACQDVSYERLLEELPLDRAARAPLFRVFFNVLNFVNDNVSTLQLEPEAPAGEPSEPSPARSVFDLTLYVHSSQSGPTLEAVYRTDLFEADSISRLLMHLQAVLETAAGDLQICLSQIRLEGAASDPSSGSGEARRLIPNVRGRRNGTIDWRTL